KNLSDKDIFKRDFTWLQKADCIVAEVTTPSLGVGYEIAVGVQRHIPVYAFFQINQHQKLSALIQGNPSIHVLLYTHCDDLLAKLELVMTSWNNTKKRP
ncbi:MAG: nucleoside 2-deoxyribosyltransferase, partial [Candidatus Marinimicrobia bacterium]|nr:nucleoside 2-deoxyribosyltransferase [Candidatus Neomarinimicrobiota bacterium]